eukprot:m.2603 g.2603  ORF g.2603 m.2603 type:complete len:809 (+) comp2553_c0_seq1:104-2530(+)
MERHRPTGKLGGVRLKQENKKHKTGRHRSKSQCADDNRGRVEQYNSLRKRGHKATEARRDRKNRMNQIRSEKRKNIMAAKRPQSDEPHVVVVISLCGEATDSVAVIKQLTPTMSMDYDGPQPIDINGDGSCVLVRPQESKGRSVLLTATSATDILSILQVASAADTVVFAISVQEEIDEFGDLCTQCVRAQGMASVAHVVMNMDLVTPKRKSEVKKYLTKTATSLFPDTKLHILEASRDPSGILWSFVNQKNTGLSWRDKHPYILTQESEFVPNAEDPSQNGTLIVKGYVRGRSLDPNRLVCLPGYGAFQVKKIECLPTERFRKKKSQLGDSMDTHDTNTTTAILSPSPELQESLQSEVPIDPMAGEQTWPSDQEIRDAREETMLGNEESIPESKGKLVRVPKGTSSYQASWIVDAFDLEEEEDNDNKDGLSDEDMETLEDGTVDELCKEDDNKRVHFEEPEESDYVTLESQAEISAAKYDQEMDVSQDKADRERILAAKEDIEFPDEVDTPTNILAKVRFQKYRGLQSFRHSPWDPREELPIEYARIFQFQNFRTTMKRILKAEEDFGVADVGTQVILHIADVPSAAGMRWKEVNRDNRFVVYGLLKHENKISLLNFKIKLVRSQTEPIKSKEPLIFCTGLRYFKTQPIYSQHSLGDKHKFEKFMHPGAVCMASTFAPIHYPTMPTLVFRQMPSGGIRLVATGSLVSVNPDRMVIKRIRLAGHPFKINKRSAVVRYMFWNPEDIHWYKPVELVTKYGRRGHIKESLGTHGHMKCIFDKQIIAQDTVMMNLYKRVYPKWTYKELLLAD